jgi:hypothetical protein
MSYNRIIALLLFLAISCTKKDEVPPTIEQPKSAIKGTLITLADCSMDKLDASGVIITATDSVNGKVVATAVSDPTGTYTLKDIPTGTYTLTFEKQDFGTYKIYNRKHVVTKLDSISLVQLTKKKTGIGKIESLQVSPYGDKLAAGGVLNRQEDCWTAQCIIYFDDQPTVDYNNYQFVSSFDRSSIQYIPLKNIYALGLKSGQTIYYTAYIEQLHSVPYFDPNFGVKIRPNIDFPSKTAISSFTLP